MNTILRPSIPTSIRIPLDLRRVLRRQARTEHRSISGLIVYVLDTYARSNDLYAKHPGPPRGKRRTPEEMEEAGE